MYCKLRSHLRNLSCEWLNTLVLKASSTQIRNTHFWHSSVFCRICFHTAEYLAWNKDTSIISISPSGPQFPRRKKSQGERRNENIQIMVAYSSQFLPMNGHILVRSSCVLSSSCDETNCEIYGRCPAEHPFSWDKSQWPKERCLSENRTRDKSKQTWFSKRFGC